MIDYIYFSGTCSDVNPANGWAWGISKNQLPNGTYPVGTAAEFSCHTGYVWNGPDAKCVLPGIWIPRTPQCFPVNQCK